MGKFQVLIAAAGLATAFAQPAMAIHVEQDYPGLQNPKARLAEEVRAAEAHLNGGTTSVSGSSFTSLNGIGLKRKPFPPGFSRSGYTFEDEVLALPPKPVEAPKEPPALQPAPATPDTIR